MIHPPRIILLFQFQYTLFVQGVNPPWPTSMMYGLLAVHQLQSWGKIVRRWHWQHSQAVPQFIACNGGPPYSLWYRTMILHILQSIARVGRELHMHEVALLARTCRQVRHVSIKRCIIQGASFRRSQGLEELGLSCLIWARLELLDGNWLLGKLR